MSIINKMLQDLDKRQAAPDPDAPASSGPSRLAQQVRPVAAVKVPSMGSNLFWRIMAGVMVVVVLWVIWLMWQLTPRSVVTDLAYRSVGRARGPVPAPAAAPVPAAPVAPPPVAVASPPAPAPAVVQPAPAPTMVPSTPASPARQAAPALPIPAAPPAPVATKPAAAAPSRPAVDMLRLATEIAAPIRNHVPKVSPTARPPARQTVASVAQTPRISNEARAAKTADRPASPAAKAQPPTHKAQATIALAPEAARIDKRVDTSPRERAETEFRRAMALVNQGRMAEGMDELRAALAADSSYDLARQTLVALLLEAKRTSEAAGLLQDGLAINPANVPYAMLLARIHVERGDPHGALALLQKSESVARNNAEYQAFVAALFQRLGRHADAVERYRGALRLSAGVGAWWVGLGISQEALSREQDASESFHRAKGTGSLSPELIAYVDRRLKVLR